MYIWYIQKISHWLSENFPEPGRLTSTCGLLPDMTLPPLILSFVVYKLTCKCVPRNFHWGGGARPEGEIRGRTSEGRERDGFIGEGAVKPFVHQLGGLGERCQLPSGVWSGTPTAKRFSTIFNLS